MIPFDIFRLEIEYGDEKLQICAQELAPESLSFRLSHADADRMEELCPYVMERHDFEGDCIEGHAMEGQIEKKALLRAFFHDFQASAFVKIEIGSWEIFRISEDEDAVCFRLETKDAAFRAQSMRLSGEYLRYIRLKTQALCGEITDGELSEGLTGYPARLETEWSDSLEMQLKTWLDPGETKAQRPGSLAAGAMPPMAEDAIEIDRPQLYAAYTKAGIAMLEGVWMDAVSPLMEGIHFTHIYLGNAFCPELLPENLPALLARCAQDGLEPVLVLPPMAEGRVPQFRGLLDAMLTWEKAAGRGPAEVVVNDIGLLQLLKETYEGRFKITLGILLNKRRKDSRLQYKKGCEKCRQLLAENDLNAPEVLQWLQADFGVSRISWESLPYAYTLGNTLEKVESLSDEPAAMAFALHLPFYQMNTGTYCPLHAAVTTGHRGHQCEVKGCSHVCENTAVLYPDFLKMAGFYNSLFGIDTEIMTHGGKLAGFLRQGVDRLVFSSRLIGKLPDEAYCEKEDLGEKTELREKEDFSREETLLAKAPDIQNASGHTAKKQRMRITAGLGSVDDYEDFVAAGADALYCGYVPADWAEKYGLFVPLNRREVIYYKVQIGSMTELRILKSKIDRLGVPVTLTFNALYYLPEQYPVVAGLLEELAHEGFASVIIADFYLLRYLKSLGLTDKLDIHVSGEMGEISSYGIAACRALGAKCMIFHRKNSPETMAECIHQAEDRFFKYAATSEGSCPEHAIASEGKCPDRRMAYEAFALNEMCHYHGGYCNSLHCDELTHICLLPWQLGPVWEPDQEKAEAGANQEDVCKAAISDAKDGRTGTYCTSISVAEDDEAEDDEAEVLEDAQPLGSSGCGLCALWRLRDAGITDLKVVSRGNYSDATAADIRALRRALTILDESDSETEYIAHMKQELFPKGCSGNCYYRLSFDF